MKMCSPGSLGSSERVCLIILDGNLLLRRALTSNITYTNRYVHHTHTLKQKNIFHFESTLTKMCNQTFIVSSFIYLQL